MEQQLGEEPAVQNAQNWLRLIFHVLTCNSAACVLGERCVGGKYLLSHIIGCSQPAGCAEPSCSSVRRLLIHWLRCQDANCRLCMGVWRDLSGLGDELGHAPVHDERRRHLEYSMVVTPPDQPSTPQREGLGSVSSSEGGSDGEEGSRRAAGPYGAAADMIAAAAPVFAEPDYGREGGLYHHQDMAMELEPAPLMQPAGADRAVVQLLEATAYMRYLLQTLMSRSTRDAPGSVPGRNFWFGVAAPHTVAAQQLDYLQHQQHHYQQHDQQQRQPEMVPPDAAAVAAAAAGAPARTSAGRRLLQHRLMCRNPHCALCAGTCELFTRGHALHHDPALPAGMLEMDDIVHELSLALNNINL